MTNQNRLPVWHYFAYAVLIVIVAAGVDRILTIAKTLLGL